MSWLGGALPADGALGAPRGDRRPRDHGAGPHEPEPERVLRAAVLPFSIFLQHIAGDHHWTQRFLLRR